MVRGRLNLDLVTLGLDNGVVLAGLFGVGALVLSLLDGGGEGPAGDEHVLLGGGGSGFSLHGARPKRGSCLASMARADMVM